MNDRTVATWLALLLFGVYLLTFSGRIPSYDGTSMFAVTQSVVKRGEFNTDDFWTLFKARDELAADGESYAKYGYGASLFAVPLYALALALPEVGLVQTTVLTSSVVIAISGALLFLAARRLQFSRGVSLAVALLFGLATPAWVYAREFWSEPFGLFTLFVAFYALLCWRQEGHARDALIAGGALGLAVATRVTNAALVPVFVWYGFGNALRDERDRRGLVLCGAMLAAAALSIGWYDWVRYGNPLATGYRSNEHFDNPLLLGLYGLLFSPGKGLFVYVPFFAALPFSFVLFYRRASRAAMLVLLTFACYLVTFSLWYYWWDGTNWSTRFLVPTLPFLMLAMAPAIELAAHNLRRTAGVAFAVILSLLGILSALIELLGVSVPALTYWLRMYRLPLAPVQVLFVPELSPFVVYWDLLKPKLLDLAWVRMPGTQVNVDVLALAAALALVVLAAVGLVSAFRRTGLPDSGTGRGLAIALLIATAIALFSLYRYRDDYRFNGSDGYRALIATVAAESQSRDVLILNDDVYGPFFLNENRARIRLYSLSRDPKQWDDATVALLQRISSRYARVWFAYDDGTATLPNLAQDWLERSLHSVSERDYDDGVHLTLYATGARP